MQAEQSTHTDAMVQREGARVRTRSRFRWWDYPIFAVLTLAVCAATAQVLYHWRPFSMDVASALFSLAIGAIGCFNLGIWFTRWLMLPLMQTPVPMQAPAGWRVGVATTFVPGAESIEMLEETVRALVAMDYPHETWVLDEGDDDDVKALCARLGARHFSRRNMPQYQTQEGTFKARTKYGNYNAWLHELGYRDYDIFVAFDTDHIPAPNFLTRMIGYFKDERIGYVQSAQAYYNQRASFIARGAAEETYAYFSSIQMSSYALGYPIVTGCHNAHRVSALKSVGGFAPHDADDLLIGLYYRAQGWHGVYVPEILARGLTPVDWHGYLTQQRRWARSTLDIKFRIYPRLARHLPLTERFMSFIQGFYYLRSLITATQILLLGIMIATGSTPAGGSAALAGALSTLAVIVVLCDFYRQRFYLDVRREWGLHWRAGLLEYAKWPSFLLALIDVLRGYGGPYTITTKVRTASKRKSNGYAHAIVAGGLALALLLGSRLPGSPGSAVLLSGVGVILASLGVMLSMRLRFPPDYDPALRAAFDERAVPMRYRSTEER